MNIKDMAKTSNQKLLIIKNGGGQNSLKRSIAFFGSLIISGGFILMAYRGKLDSETFLTYALSLVILYCPQLAKDLLLIWKGKPEGETNV